MRSREQYNLQFSLRPLSLCFLVLLYVPLFGQAFKINNGVNIQASYYNQGRVNIGWELMQTYPEIQAVRIEIEPYRVQQARQWIKEAHENGYQVIATYHDSKKLGSDNKEDLMDAVLWWEDYYAMLTSSGPIIINIMNEWGSHNISPEDYAGAYNAAISRLRSFYKGKLIVDVPGFGQATKIAADAFPLFEEQNFTYSIHVYTSAFNIEQKRWLSHEDLAYLDATGVDCMVGEFCDTATGGADWCSIIDECFANNWPLFGWAWNGDGGRMNMTQPHWSEEPLATEFQPTEFMKVITDKLAGVPCYTQPDDDCTSDLITESCDDGNPYTINDRYNEYCHCTGNFAPTLQGNTTESKLFIYPNPVRSSQELNVEFFKINVRGDLIVYNSIGETLISKTIDKDLNSLTVNTSQLLEGVYWISLHNSDKVVYVEKFVVN